MTPTLPKKKKVKSPAASKLLVARTGKASSAKPAEGDEPVFAYIASLPQPQRAIAERIDALADACQSHFCPRSRARHCIAAKRRAAVLACRDGVAVVELIRWLAILPI